jgi:hypothetical protein
VEPPAAKGTTNSMGLAGNFSAAPTGLKRISGEHSNSTQKIIVFFPISSSFRKVLKSRLTLAVSEWLL